MQLENLGTIKIIAELRNIVRVAGQMPPSAPLWTHSLNIFKQRLDSSLGTAHSISLFRLNKWVINGLLSPAQFLWFYIFIQIKIWIFIWFLHEKLWQYFTTDTDTHMLNIVMLVSSVLRDPLNYSPNYAWRNLAFQLDVTLVKTGVEYYPNF